jgi:hypothetical protein
LSPTPADHASREADVVVLAVPDRHLGRIAREVIDQVKPGTLVMTLDPAAAYAGEIPLREDLGFFVTHPCHPPIYSASDNDAIDPRARNDFFGGAYAPQPVVCALFQGTEADYALGESLVRILFAPVSRIHRITVEQMAILEPAMAETVTNSCISIIGEALDEAVRRGVPPQAARDFLLGHVNIPLATLFGQIHSPISDGARLILEYGRRKLFRPGWKRVFEPASVKEQVQAIVSGELPTDLDA